MTDLLQGLRRAYEARAEPVKAVAWRYGIRETTLCEMARLFGWRIRRPGNGKRRKLKRRVHDQSSQGGQGQGGQAEAP